jgi:hypothetical protein
VSRTFITIAIGVFTAVGAFQARADNIVNNPGFETGDFTGWALSGTHSSADDNGIYYGVDALDAHSGSNGAYFGAVGGVLNLSQTLTTTPGDTYSLSFWLAQSTEASPPYTNSFQVSFGGVTLFSVTDAPVSDYTEYTYSVVAHSSSTSLQFGFRNDTGFYSLDDVAALSSAPTAVPEPASILLVGPFLGGLALIARRSWRQRGSLGQKS